VVFYLVSFGLDLKYLRLIIVIYAFFLLVGCGSSEPQTMSGVEVQPTAVPTIPPDIMKVYTLNGTLLTTYVGKFRDCYSSGECIIKTEKGYVRVKEGIIIVEPNHAK